MQQINLYKETELIACHEALNTVSELQQRDHDKSLWQPAINRLTGDIKRLERELSLTPYNYGIEHNKIILEEC